MLSCDCIFSYAVAIIQAEVYLQHALDKYEQMLNERHLCPDGCNYEHLEGFEEAKREVEDCGRRLETLQALEEQELAAAEERRERMRKEEAEKENKRRMEEAVAIAVQKVRAEMAAIYDFDENYFDQ